jgi:hypothetical protein
MPRLKPSMKKKPVRDEKEDLSSSRKKCRGQNKSYSMDAEDETSPRRNSRMKRKAARKDTGKESLPKRTSGRERKEVSKDLKQESSPRKSIDLFYLQDARSGCINYLTIYKNIMQLMLYHSVTHFALPQVSNLISIFF